MMRGHVRFTSTGVPIALATLKVAFALGFRPSICATLLADVLNRSLR